MDFVQLVVDCGFQFEKNIKYIYFNYCQTFVYHFHKQKSHTDDAGGSAVGTTFCVFETTFCVFDEADATIDGDFDAGTPEFCSAKKIEFTQISNFVYFVFTQIQSKLVIGKIQNDHKTSENHQKPFVLCLEILHRFFLNQKVLTRHWFIIDSIELQTAQIFLETSMIFTCWVPLSSQSVILCWIIIVQFSDDA